MSSTTLWYITRASGIVALVLLTVTMVLGLTTTSRARAAQLARLRPTGAPSTDIDALGGLCGHPRAHQHPRHLRAYRVVGDRRPFCVALQPILGGNGNRGPRPHGGRLSLESAPFTDEAGNVARRPLAGLRLLADCVGPHIRPRYRRGRALGHHCSASCVSCRSERRCCGA